MRTNKMNFRIYVANLRAYNEGEYVGKWIDLQYDDVEQCIKDVLGTDEEYAIHDYEAPFEIHEYSSIKTLMEVSEAVSRIEEHTYIKFLAVMEIESNKIEDICDIVDSLEEYRLFEGISNDEELGIELVEQDYIEVPEHLKMYFDYESYGHDYACNTVGDYSDHGYITRN